MALNRLGDSTTFCGDPLDGKTVRNEIRIKTAVCFRDKDSQQSAIARLLNHVAGEVTGFLNLVGALGDNFGREFLSAFTDCSLFSR